MTVEYDLRANRFDSDHGARGQHSGPELPVPGRRTLAGQLPPDVIDAAPGAPAMDVRSGDRAPAVPRDTGDPGARIAALFGIPGAKPQAPRTDEPRGGLSRDLRMGVEQRSEAPAAARPAPRLPSSGGQALPTAVRQTMQRAFGYDFSDVRVHEGPEAEAMGALAFTRGTDLFFRPGLFAPDSDGGRKLLGHELAHVVQQAEGRVSATRQLNDVAINEDAALESEADALGARAARGDLAGRSGPGGAEAALAPLRGSGGGVVQRAIGMELETTLPIVLDADYHQALYDNKEVAWKITDDGGKVEFVTRPLRTREALVGAVAEITRFVASARKLLAAGKPVPIATILADAGLPTGTATGSVGGPGYKPAMLDAKPQVTVGIPMASLAQLLADARDLPLAEYDEQHATGTSPEGAQPGHRLLYDETSPVFFAAPARVDSLAAAVAWGRAMKLAHPKLKDVDAAVGLMALVLKYLNEAQFKPHTDGTPDYAKAYFPVMARTHFVAMFESLGDAAELITPDEIIACWGQSAIVKRMQMFPLGYVDGSKAGKKDVHGVNHGPTIGAWLDSIAGDAKTKAALKKEYAAEDKELMDHYASSPDQEFRDGTRGAVGKDLLSRGAVAFSSISMGLFGMDRRESVPLAVLEFRQFPPDAGLQSAYWEALAGRLFDFYTDARGKTDPDALVTQVMWGKDVLRSLRQNVRYQTEQLRNTTDDELSDRALALGTRTLEQLGKLSATDHDDIRRLIQEFAAALRPLRERHANSPRTTAPSVTRAAALATLKTGAGASRKPSVIRDVLEKYVTTALGALYVTVERHPVESFNKELQAAFARIQRGPMNASSAEDWDEFYEDTGQRIADLQARAVHYRAHGTFDGAPDEATPDAAAAQRAAASDARSLEKYGRRELRKAALPVPEHDAHASLGLAAGVETLRSATTKALAEAKTQEAFLAAIDSFAAGYAKLRALFVTLEPAREPTAPSRPGRDFGEGGNCLFDATSAMLAGGQTAAQLRQLTATRVRLHPLEYVDRLVNGGDHGDVMEEMRDAADFLAVSGNWDHNAGEIAPIALADVLADKGRHLVILNADGSIRYTGPGAGEPVFIYYNGVNHYTSAEG
jgi:hypothetical protein